MKLSEAQAAKYFATLSIDDDDLVSPKEYTFTKAQSVRLLDRMYIDYITAHGLPDNAPDHRGLLEENIRNEAPSSSFDGASFKRRGNRTKWGAIPCYRQRHGKNCRVYFRESDLVDWFNHRYIKALTKVH